MIKLLPYGFVDHSFCPMVVKLWIVASYKWLNLEIWFLLDG
jgi:hypothetical protein